MTKWIEDMSLAPAKEEWVLGQVLIDENDPDSGLVPEVIICDGGYWMNATGLFVKPMAWARIEPFNPKHAQMRYEWEGSLESMFNEIAECMPPGFILMGMAVGNTETGEGAIIGDNDTPDPEMAVWHADVSKDILGDAQHTYQRYVDGLFPNGH